MKSGLEYTNVFCEFQQEITKIQNNLKFFIETQNLIDARKNEVLNESLQDWNHVRKSVYGFRNIMNKFNSDVDMVIADFNKYCADGDSCTVGMQQQTGDNQCQITHIVNSEKCICYAVDIHGETMSALKMFWKEAPFLQFVPANKILDSGDIVGIEIDSKINRAKIVFDTTLNLVRAHLIDTGEMICVKNIRLQNLPDDVKSLPAAAFQCRINQIGGTEAHSLSDSLKDQIFVYRIDSIDETNGIHHIDIHSTNPFSVGFTSDMNVIPNANANANADADGDVNWNLEQTENETLQHKWNILGNASKKSLISSSIYNSNYDLNDNTLNGFQSAENRNAIAPESAIATATMMMPSTRGLPIDVRAVNDDGCEYGDGDGGGAAALELLQMTRTDEKSISIKNRSNASTAPVSSVRSTKYKRQTNIINDSSRAYSNDHRRHHHPNTLFEIVRPMKTQCKTTVVQSHHSKLKIPRVAEQITIIPTYVLNAREFYGQLGSHFNALHYSQQRLNYRQLHFKNEQYSQLPGESELVLVLLENGFFHRAKVLNGSNSQQITVFLLDYGITHLVELRHIYKWTQNCDRMPFCAVLFTLSNVQITDPFETRIVEYATEKIPKTFTAAEVTNIDERSISVRIFDDSGFDIGEEINCFSMDKISNDNTGC